MAVIQRFRSVGFLDGARYLRDARHADAMLCRLVAHRYGPGHLVSRSIQRATPMIPHAVEEVHGRAARTAQVRGPEQGKCPHSLAAGAGR